MDQSLKSPPLSALDDAFHAQFDASRAEPAPTLAERLDRLARLRAAVADNEARFEQAISADFGHRSAIETTIAETLFLLCRDQARDKTFEEMDGAAAHRDRAAIPAGEEPADAAAARRGRHHRALELSAAADARARDRRASPPATG